MGWQRPRCCAPTGIVKKRSIVAHAANRYPVGEKSLFLIISPSPSPLWRARALPEGEQPRSARSQALRLHVANLRHYPGHAKSGAPTFSDFDQPVNALLSHISIPPRVIHSVKDRGTCSHTGFSQVARAGAI